MIGLNDVATFWSILFQIILHEKYVTQKYFHIQISWIDDPPMYSKLMTVRIQEMSKIRFN